MKIQKQEIMEMIKKRIKVLVERKKWGNSEIKKHKKDLRYYLNEIKYCNKEIQTWQRAREEIKKVLED